MVSEWLGEPSVEPLERIKRGLCEQLYSAKEVEDLNLQPGTPSLGLTSGLPWLAASGAPQT